MGQGKNKYESLLQELIARAKRRDIEVRTEKLLREVGYRVHSGRCRLRGQELIILDRETPVTEQVDFLAAELEQLGLERPAVKSQPKAGG